MQHVPTQEVQRIRLLVFGHLTPKEVLSTLQVFELIGQIIAHHRIHLINLLIIAHLLHPQLIQKLIMLRQVLADQLVPLLQLPAQASDLNVVQLVLVFQVRVLDLRRQALDVEVHQVLFGDALLISAEAEVFDGVRQEFAEVDV